MGTDLHQLMQAWVFGAALDKASDAERTSLSPWTERCSRHIMERADEVV